MQIVFTLLFGFVLGALFYMYMYDKHVHKRKFYTRLSRDGSYRLSSKNETGVSSDSLISKMQWLYKKDGRVVVEFIDDEEIHMTSLGTLKDELANEKLNDIKELIKKSL